MSKIIILKKYFILIYVVVLALAIIAFLGAVLSEGNNILHSTLINLATELFGVVLVFFLVQYLFKVDEVDTNERIEKLLNKLENETVVEASNFFHSQPNMDDYILSANTIKIVGVTLTVCIDKGMGVFKQAIKNGASVKIVLIDGSEESLSASALRSETNSTSYYRKKHAATTDNLDYLLKYVDSLEVSNKGKIEIKTISYPSIVGIEVFVNENTKLGKAKIEIYAQYTGWEKPPIFTVDKYTDKEWFKYFEDQFDEIWTRAKPYEPNHP